MAEINIDPKLYEQFSTKILSAFYLPTTTRRIIEEFIVPDVKAEVVAKIVQRNQYFENLMYTEVKTLGLKDNVPSLQALIALMGMQNVRNFICAMQLFRITSKKHPTLGKDGKYAVKASEYLKYALRAEEFATASKMQGAEHAFAAGYIYDLLRIIGKESFAQAKPFEEALDGVFKHGIRAAIIASNIAKGMKTFVYQKQAFGTAMILDAGRVVMEMLFPPGSANSYASLRDDLGKKPVSRSIAHFVERKRFGITHEHFSALIANAFFLFKPVEKAVLFHHEPYLIKAQKDMYTFAALMTLASGIASNYRVPKDTEDPIFNAWLAPELRGFPIEKKAILDVMRKAGNYSF